MLDGLAARHPSRTIVLVPRPDAAGRDRGRRARSTASRSARAARSARRRSASGSAASGPRVPASVVQPLFIADLPVFLRWRGLPPFGDGALRGARRRRRPADRGQHRVAGPARARTRDLGGDLRPGRRLRHRVGADEPLAAALASLWPGIAGVQTIRVTATAAQAHLLAGWLRSRLGHDVALEHVDGRPPHRGRAGRRAGAVPARATRRTRPTCCRTSSTASAATASTRRPSSRERAPLAAELPARDDLEDRLRDADRHRRRPGHLRTSRRAATGRGRGRGSTRGRASAAAAPRSRGRDRVAGGRPRVRLLAPLHLVARSAPRAGIQATSGVP